MTFDSMNDDFVHFMIDEAIAERQLTSRVENGFLEYQGVLIWWSYKTFRLRRRYRRRRVRRVWEGA